jgi:hypothetical protein
MGDPRSKTVIRPAPIGKWTKLGALARCCGPRKPDRFFIENFPDDQAPVDINLRDTHLRWLDNTWHNLGCGFDPGIGELNEDQTEDMITENRFLRNQIETLLDMNANYEMKKIHLQDKLDRLLDQIKHFPGLDEDLETF